MSRTGGVFAGISGNAQALEGLERALSYGELSHAYLFHGPRGVGKRTVARRFGAALVSGGDVAAEERARRGMHADLAEVEPEGQFTTIGQVREVLRQAASRPFEGVRRVFLLQAGTLNVQAANALLKTLEQPEGNQIFVLLASSREAVLPTVLSRTRQVRFGPVPLPEVEQVLREQYGVQGDEARLAAALGRGSVGLALRYAMEDELRGLRQTVSEAGLHLDGDFEDVYAAAERISARAGVVGSAREAAFLEDTEEPDRRARESAKRAGRAARDGAVAEALLLLAFLYRDAAVMAAGIEELAVNADWSEEIKRVVEEHPEADWMGAAAEVCEGRISLAYNVSPEAILEVALSGARQRILRKS